MKTFFFWRALALVSLASRESVLGLGFFVSLASSIPALASRESVLGLGFFVSLALASSLVWRVKRERAPIAVNRLGCTTSELL